MGWKGWSQASFGKGTNLLQAPNELLPGWRGSFAPYRVLRGAGWVGDRFVC